MVTAKIEPSVRTTGFQYRRPRRRQERVRRARTKSNRGRLGGMPRSSFRPAGRSRQARNSPPNPCLKDREPRYRQASVQSAPFEVSIRLGPRIGLPRIQRKASDLPPYSVASAEEVIKAPIIF